MSNNSIQKENANLTGTEFKFFLFSLLGYCFCAFYHGVLIHWGLRIGFFITTRTFLPEVFLLPILLIWISSRPKIELPDFLLLIYVLLVLVASYNSRTSVKTVATVIRNLFLPILLLAISSSIVLSNTQLEITKKALAVFFKIFIVLGLIMCIWQRKVGWEKTAIYYAGYSYYGLNDTLSVKINYGTWGFSTPSLTGNSVNFAAIAAFSAIVLWHDKGTSKALKIIYFIIAIIEIYLSSNKTAFLALIIILMQKIFSMNSESLSKAIKTISIIALFAFVIWLTFFENTIEALYSMRERVNDWSVLLGPKYLVNLIFPHMAFDFSAGANNGVSTNAWDNAFYYMAYSIGLLGLFFFLAIVYRKNKYIVLIDKSGFTFDILFLLILSSVSTCVFFGRSTLTITMVMIGFLYGNAKNCLEKENNECISN